MRSRKNNKRAQQACKRISGVSVAGLACALETMQKRRCSLCRVIDDKVSAVHETTQSLFPATLRLLHHPFRKFGSQLSQSRLLKAWRA